jgi:hypothetical protein
MKTNNKTADGSNNIIATDYQLHKVFIFSFTGDLVAQFGSEGNGEGQVKCPRGVAITIEGEIVVAEFDNHRIQFF